MKFPFIFSLVLTQLLSLQNPTIAQPISETKKTVIEQQVDSFFTASVKLSEKLDYDQLSASVDDRYNSGFITNNVYYARFDSLISLLKDRVSGISGQHITILKKKITVLSEEIALVTAYGISDIGLASGRQFKTKFYWSFVYQKFNGKWKVIQSHQSSNRED